MKHPYATALAAAEAAVLALRPHCARIEIAGSLRRRCPAVGDVEIVCIPKQEPEAIDLFTRVMVRSAAFVRAVESWPRIRGTAHGRYTRRRLPEGIDLDLFIATAENWGVIFAIRTGSAEFSRCLAARWSALGYRSRGGLLYRAGAAHSCPEEQDLFRLLDIPFVPPEARNV